MDRRNIRMDGPPGAEPGATKLSVCDGETTVVKQFLFRGARQARPKEDRVVKTLLKSIFACVVVMLAGRVYAQTFTPINPPPCDFSDQFYADNGLVATAGGELNTEPDGRFGTFRQFGPPAT